LKNLFRNPIAALSRQVGIALEPFTTLFQGALLFGRLVRAINLQNICRSSIRGQVLSITGNR
jgi:hypothetical protein